MVVLPEAEITLALFRVVAVLALTRILAVGSGGPPPKKRKAQSGFAEVGPNHVPSARCSVLTDFKRASLCQKQLPSAQCALLVCGPPGWLVTGEHKAGVQLKVRTKQVAGPRATWLDAAPEQDCVLRHRPPHRKRRKNKMPNVNFKEALPASRCAVRHWCNILV